MMEVDPQTPCQGDGDDPLSFIQAHDATVLRVVLPDSPSPNALRCVERAQAEGYRVYGAWAPEQGHRFNPDKLLIDPYAKSIEGPILWGNGNVLPYVPGGEDADLERDDEDDAAAIPKSVVTDESFDWQEDDRHHEQIQEKPVQAQAEFRVDFVRQRRAAAADDRRQESERRAGDGQDLALSEDA